MFFEHYGLNYIGPVDGHNLKQLIDLFSKIKKQNDERPIIVHVVTKKGQGLSAAQNDPTAYHGVSPFNSATGEFLNSSKKEPTFPLIFGKYLLEMAKRRPEILAITPATASGSGLEDLKKHYPERCLDVGIAESHAIAFSGGLGRDRTRKVFSVVYSSFLQRSFDNIFHDVCLQNSPIVIAIDRAGLAPGDGMSHSGIYDLAFLNAMPNLIIAQPRDGNILRDLMESAINWDVPAAIRYPNQATSIHNIPIKYREPGQNSAEVLTQGKDLLIIALGHMAKTALEVQKLLEGYGVSTTVVDPIFIKPLDETLILKLMNKHSLVITLEEHSLKGGLGSIINDLAVKQNVRPHIINLGLPDSFIAHGSYKKIMSSLGLAPEQITDLVLQKLNPNRLLSNVSVNKK